jgi:GAF domain-containing protein
MRVSTEIARLGRSGEPLDAVYRAFAEGVAGLVPFDSIGVSLIDAERREFSIVDLPARTLGLGGRRDARMPLEGTLLAQVAASGAPLRVDDLAAAAVPPLSREALASRGYRSALLVPLGSRGAVAGGVTLTSRRVDAFDDTDVEVVAGLALPLAAAIEQRRLHEESRRHADETHALLQAGRAVTASLDVQETIRVILDEARRVLGVESCSVATLDAASGILTIVASLDLPSEMLTQIQLRAGEGITAGPSASGGPCRALTCSPTPACTILTFPAAPDFARCWRCRSGWASGSSARSVSSVAMSITSRLLRRICSWPWPTRPPSRWSTRACTPSSKGWWSSAPGSSTPRSASWKWCWRPCPWASSSSTRSCA